MGQLPAHHVPRPRLIAAAGDARVLVVEAGAGYGKTTLAAELVEAWRAVEVDVSLHEGGVSASLFTTQLQAALRRAGFSDAAAAMADAGYDPHGAIDAAIDVLATEPCVIVVDDVQHADRDAAVLIDRLARRIAAPQRAIVLARRLPPGCERLRRAEFVQLQPSDLTLGPDETLQLCRIGFGLDVDATDAEALRLTTGGWTAATVLAAARVRRTGESIAAVTQAADLRGGQGAVEAILDEAVGALAAADVATLAQIARVFDLDRAAVDLLADEPGFLDRALSAGVPLIEIGADRYALPGPVRDFFARQAPTDPLRLRRLADRFVGRGDLSAALRLLLTAEDARGAAELLSEASPALLDTVDLLEYSSVVDRLDAALLERHPQILLHLVRLQDSAGLLDKRCLQQVFTHRVDPRERWRVTLLRAYAAFRRGEPSAGALAARAFEQAARMGLDQLPLTKEREITHALLGLAAETGQPAALALQQGSLPAAVTVLGGFALTRGGRPVSLPAGQSAQLLKLLAVSGGQLPTERVVDALWPEADLDAGRNRLRTVLNRLRREAGEVIDRDGDRLSLSGELRVDLDRFEEEARHALALGAEEPTLAVAVARAALTRYRGDVLPDDPYEPWAERPRDRARRSALELLDLCADIAAERGDLDEVRRLVELTIDLAPYDDARYLRAATALLEQGRRGAALAVVARARTALAELGLPPPLDLVRIERLVVA